MKRRGRSCGGGCICRSVRSVPSSHAATRSYECDQRQLAAGSFGPRDSPNRNRGCCELLESHCRHAVSLMHSSHVPQRAIERAGRFFKICAGVRGQFCFPSFVRTNLRRTMKIVIAMPLGLILRKALVGLPGSSQSTRDVWSYRR